MGRIHQLDAQTANMIAAGEVVERPMGVIKELVENSIDAGSTRISVSAENGGIDRVTVSDNGCGMDSEDAVNCFGRHATSKIRGQNDLWDISTLGFRGEALPSIASVSKLTLVTSDGTDSTRVKMEYGELKSAEPYPSDQGTEISVEGLFYRTPARLKHLRSGAYENSLIQDIIMKFALSHPEIAFTFISNGREAFRTSGSGDLQEVLYLCWGREAAEKAIPINMEDFDYKGSGYLVKPEVNRAYRNFMKVFLNGRMVKTFRLYKSILDGYEAYLPQGRYPLAVVNISMDPHLLDVNVHPSKWEVRLSKENQLEYLIRDSVAETLSRQMLAPKVRRAQEAPAAAQMRMEFDAFQHAPAAVQKPAAPKPSAVSEPEEKKPESAEEKSLTAEPMKEIRKKIREETVQEPAGQYPDRTFPEMTVIGQLHSSYILCSTEQGLAVIDQKAASQRIAYEKIERQIQNNETMQDLLVPLTLKTSDDVVQRLAELNAFAEDLRISFESFGPDTLLVRSIPAWMSGLEEEKVLYDVLDLFAEEEKAGIRRIAGKKIAELASTHAIHACRKLALAEMNQFLKDLSACANPYQSPSGHATFVIIEERDLAKEFR